MKRLGENVFRFNAYGVFTRLGVSFILLIALLVITGIGFHNIIGWIFTISCAYFFLKVILFFFKAHAILDKDNNTLTIFRWTWKWPFRFENISLEEIMGTNQEESVRTETNYNKTYKRWETTEKRFYNVKIHGKFGTRRIGLANRDDWNLFMTLLYGEE